ncbi:DUF2189 domain-containing protein [Hyphomicrobium sp. DMF-1]|jgi:uncharacterized membrane protein|uniref:DUF2189 domain-containing protein n=1 Tax=Hyphomicrobium sp. DMF-1 TaxID=3019544 RepID=UPI0022EBD301|nr:DUF2189 domain-containing protein [Hyphomicrobium sp. DMF-1]WBT39846.1 DUF2189 domain-containing protein [Hyphomicrobium sp. DMF-1]
MTHSRELPHSGGALRQLGVDVRWPSSAIWRPGEPAIRKIGLADVEDALAKGIEDFKAAPSHALFLCLIYPIVGVILFRVAFGYHLLPMIYPLMAGFALLGPVAAVGLYELSRRREQGLDVSVWHIAEVYRSPSLGAIIRLGVVLLAIFVLWMMTARALYVQSFEGVLPTSLSHFMQQLSTAEGRQLIISGNVVGFFFALLVLVISAVSFPMLVDRDVGVGTAVRTSIRAFIENPLPMAAWGLVVAASLVAGAIPFFFGLAVVFPILGHATWHLYRRVVSRTEVI